MNKLLVPLILLLILNSCGPRQDVPATVSTNVTPTLRPVRVVVPAGLPDSLKPKSILLSDVPRAHSVILPPKGGILRELPVLRNESGVPVLDSRGRPFRMGEGGKSNFTGFSSDNGLALDAVSCSTTDRFGNLWFGTFGGGASRYDGTSFTSFTTAQGLANNMVWCILEDRSGNIWFGTYGGGVSRYDGRTITNFSVALGLAANIVYSIFEDSKGNLWFGTGGGGVSRYDGTSFTNFSTVQGLADNIIYSMAEDKAGNLWFGTEGGGVSRFDGTSFTTFTSAGGPAGSAVRCIVTDRSGNLWFGTDGGGIMRFDGKSFTSFTTARGLANNVVWSILEDRDGNLWFGTYGGGVSRYDGTTFTTFTTAQGLANNCVYTILEDASGTLWFGTDGGGVSRYDGGSITFFTTAQGLASNMVWSILEDHNRELWFGTNGGGVSRYNGTAITTYTTVQGVGDNIVFCVAEDFEGRLWFGTGGGGVTRFDGCSFTTFTTAQGLGNNNVRCILEDRSGNLWFGTMGGGVSRFDGHSFTTFTTAQGLGNNSVYSILQDHSGALWFGTDGGGVSRFDGRAFATYTSAHGLGNNMVYGILEDRDGNLWFGTGKGLSVLRLAQSEKMAGNSDNLTYEYKSSSALFANFTTADGLADDFVTNIVQLPNGKIALGTNLGITLLSPNPECTRLEEVEVFNSATGYPVKDVNVGQRCLFADRDGILWAGTGSEKSALVRFDYRLLKKNDRMPTLVVQRIRVDGEPVCWYDLQSQKPGQTDADSATLTVQDFFAYGRVLDPERHDALRKRFGNIRFDGITPYYPLPQHLVLPYVHNQIAFEFIAIETAKPFLVNYRYKLEGYDKDWNPVTKNTNAVFGNIKEGNYTFKLMVQGPGGTWSEPVEYTFEVLPPWYRTWWAYLVDAVLIVAAFLLISNLRERKLLAEKSKLERIVAERTAVVEKQKEELVQKNILVEKQKAVVEQEKHRSDELLLNILPGEVAEELKTKGSAEARHYDEVTVLFTDFKDFTRISGTMTPRELVEEIHASFKAIDTIIERYGIEKIKTIGDSYMCAAGLPVPCKTHPEDMVGAALEIQDYFANRINEKIAEGKEPFRIRIGIHTGPVVAGIVGIRKFAYDIWGDTVNLASRMEANGEVGRVNISGATYERIRGMFRCTSRGKVQVKGKGELDMYFVEEKLIDLKI